MPGDELLDAARELAAEITRNSPFGLRLTKQVLHDNIDAPSLEAAITVENRNQVLCMQTKDMAGRRPLRTPRGPGRPSKARAGSA